MFLKITFKNNLVIYFFNLVTCSNEVDLRGKEGMFGFWVLKLFLKTIFINLENIILVFS